MRNLISFLIRYNAFFIFLLLEIISFTWIVNKGDKGQQQVWLSTSNSISGYFNERYSNVRKYWDLPEQNLLLQKENAELRAQLRREKYNNIVDTVNVTDTAYEQRYRYIPALVVNNSVNLQNNYITLNRGRKHGIRPNSAVVSSNGIVGIVLKSSQRYSTVLSLLHRDTRISAMIKRNGFFGSLVWKSNDNSRSMTLDAIPRHADVMVNDTIITSGYSSIFPEGIMIGVVDTFRFEGGSNFYTIDVRLNTDINKIRSVYVVDDYLREEQLKLEKETKDE